VPLTFEQRVARVVHDRPEPDLGVGVDVLEAGRDHDVLLAVELARGVAAEREAQAADDGPLDGSAEAMSRSTVSGRTPCRCRP
jgi:hypothetical protein